MFWKSSDFFPKKQNLSNVPFLYLFFAFVQIFKPKRRRYVYLNVFNHIVSHFERIMWILHMMNGITIFGASSFIFTFMSYWLAIKLLGAWCAFEKVEEKTKCQKMNVNLFPNKLGWIISLSFFEVRSLGSTILYNDFQHNILALQGRANTQP